MSSKRKTLNDFFATDRPAKTPKLCEEGDERALASPLGASIISNFITQEQEIDLLRFLDSQAWRTDLSRRTMHYGGTYCLMPPKDASPQMRKQIEDTIITAPSMPKELELLIDKMISRGMYTDKYRPAYCIVNEYRPGQGISAHVENFRFGEPVCSLTLAGADSMRFHQLGEAHDGSVRSGRASAAPKTGVRTDVMLGRRSLLILRGDARSTWQHEIVRGKTKSKPKDWRRVSLTFRVEKKIDTRGRG